MGPSVGGLRTSTMEALSNTSSALVYTYLHKVLRTGTGPHTPLEVVVILTVLWSSVDLPNGACPRCTLREGEIPQLAATYCDIPQDTATHHNTPRHTATYRDLPRHTATYRDIPRHTATYRMCVRGYNCRSLALKSARRERAGLRLLTAKGRFLLEDGTSTRDD